MSKRSSFERRPRDFYPTPMHAVLPLLPHLAPGTRFCEPCAGDGALIRHLEGHGHRCVIARDIEPKAVGIEARCVLGSPLPLSGVQAIITNPPWARNILHQMIDKLPRFAPTWLLFDADWIHTIQSAPYIGWCRKIVSVGRVKWIPGSAHVGKDNCCWYLFDRQGDGAPEFVGRDVSSGRRQK